MVSRPSYWPVSACLSGPKAHGEMLSEVDEDPASFDDPYLHAAILHEAA